MRNNFVECGGICDKAHGVVWLHAAIDVIINLGGEQQLKNDFLFKQRQLSSNQSERFYVVKTIFNFQNQNSFWRDDQPSVARVSMHGRSVSSPHDNTSHTCNTLPWRVCTCSCTQFILWRVSGECAQRARAFHLNY